MSNEQNEQLQVEDNDSLNMNLRNEEDGTTIDISKEEVSKEPEVSKEVLDEARKYGYKTKEELEAEGKAVDKIKTPEEFIEYGKKYDREKALESKLDKLQRQLEEQQEFQKRSAEALVRQTINNLEKQLVEAKLNGDTNAVEALTVQKHSAQQQQMYEVHQRQLAEMSKIDEIFLERNSDWFNDENPNLKIEAKLISDRLKLENPNISYGVLAMEVEKEMRWKHKEISNFQQKTNPVPHISSNKSSINKSSANVSSEDPKAFRSLSSNEQLEFNSIKDMLKEMKINYTVKDYLERK